MAKHFINIPEIDPADDGLGSVSQPAASVARTAAADEFGSPRTTRPVSAHNSVSNGDTTGFVAVVSEPDAKNKRKKYKRNTHSDKRFSQTDPYDIHNYRKGRGRKAARNFSTVLFVIGILLLLVAGGLWLKAQWNYHQQDVQVERKQSFAVISDDPNTAPVVNWGKLRADNEDVVGWVQIPGTPVNFPVYQGVDNDEYLHTSSDGEYALGGEVFLDCDNIAPGMVDGQTIIYGHHLRNGAMFKPIADMDNQAFFDSIETVWYCTEGGNYELVPLLCYYADPYDTSVRTFFHEGDEGFYDYLNGLLGKAVTRRADADQVIGNCSHVFSMVTCNYLDEMGGDGRTIVVCVPKSEIPTN